jgi:hypothetical protein
MTYGMTSPNGVLLNRLIKFRQMGSKMKARSTSNTMAAEREQTGHSVSFPESARALAI